MSKIKISITITEEFDDDRSLEEQLEKPLRADMTTQEILKLFPKAKIGVGYDDSGYESEEDPDHAEVIFITNRSEIENRLFNEKIKQIEKNVWGYIHEQIEKNTESSNIYKQLKEIFQDHDCLCQDHDLCRDQEIYVKDMGDNRQKIIEIWQQGMRENPRLADITEELKSTKRINFHYFGLVSVIRKAFDNSEEIWQSITTRGEK